MIINWLKAFLQNRQARVRCNNTLGSTRILRQGLPQGSVLAPLLFLFCINHLAESLDDDTLEIINSMFADDVAIVATDRDRSVALGRVQKAVEKVASWSSEWKLNLNVEKSEISFFSNWTREAGWRPEITINGEAIPYQEFPRLLGVVLDRQLTFTKHTENVTKAGNAACRILAALAHTEWGWDKDNLMKIYFSHVKSKLDYAAAGWQGSLAECNMLALERTQNKALRYITGQYKDTPIPTLRAEAQITSYETQSDRILLKSREKAFRSAPDNPRRMALEAPAVPKRLDRHSWRSKTEDLAKKLTSSITPRKPLTYFSTQPWALAQPIEVYANVPGVSGRSDKQEIKAAASYTRIKELSPSYTIYTDGSATAGTSEGGGQQPLSL
jgi:hypothetical protein